MPFPIDLIKIPFYSLNPISMLKAQLENLMNLLSEIYGYMYIEQLIPMKMITARFPHQTTPHFHYFK